jgi:uncharacterized protein involved in exopolysaccharide biosynthesis
MRSPVHEELTAWSATSSQVDNLIARIWSRRWLLVLVAVLGAGAGVLKSVLQTRIYEANVTLSPTKSDRGANPLAATASQFGDLAATLGVSLPGSGSASSAVNLAYLKSRKFAADFIQKNGLTQLFFPDAWDVQAKRWRSVHGKQPTIEDAVLYFDTRVRRIEEDHRTGLITLSVRWRDRDQAMAWANQMVADINSESRQRAISEAQQSLQYLRGELDNTSLVGLRDAIYRLMESNIKSITFANVRRDFAFEIVDPATVPDADHYVKPSWPLNIGAGFVAGCLGGVVLALLRTRRERGSSGEPARS